MTCPRCGQKSGVIDSRRVGEREIRRRRECQVCKYRFTTYEGIRGKGAKDEAWPEQVRRLAKVLRAACDVVLEDNEE